MNDNQLKKKDQVHSYDVGWTESDERELQKEMIVSEFNAKLDRASGENRAQVKKQLQKDFDIEMEYIMKKRI